LYDCSFFKTLTNQTVTIELKNDIRIRGILKSVDQYLNIKLDDVEVLDLVKYPHLSSVKNMFIRGSVVRYVMLPRSEVDVGLLEDATRRGELHGPLQAESIRNRCALDVFFSFGYLKKPRQLHGLRLTRQSTEASNQAGKAR
jgi:U6 snRNA-associated Sm-like protein LSm2